MPPATSSLDPGDLMTSPVQAMLDEQRRTAARVMSSFGPSATIGRAAEFYGTAGSVAEGGGVCEPFGFAKSLDAYRGVASAVQDSLAEHDRLMSSFGSPSTVAGGGAGIYGKLGPVAKAGWMPDTAGVTNSWQSRAGVASVVRDTLAEQQRMQDQLMKSLGPLATVASPGDMYGIAGSSVAKGSVMREPFGFTKSLDAHNAAADIRRVQDTLAAQERMREKLMGYDTVAASAARAYAMPGLVTGVGGYGPGFGRVPTIADSASFSPMCVS